MGNCEKLIDVPRGIPGLASSSTCYHLCRTREQQDRRVVLMPPEL